MSEHYDVNIAEKYYGKLNAQGEPTIADFVYDLAGRYKIQEDKIKELEQQNKFLKKELKQLANFNPDWDRLEACQETLKEHVQSNNTLKQSRIERDKELLEKIIPYLDRAITDRVVEINNTPKKEYDFSGINVRKIIENIYVLMGE